MFSPDSAQAPNIAKITIVCGWLFTALAALAVILHFWSRITIVRRTSADDYLILVAFTIAVAIVAQTTWAIDDENLGKELDSVTRKQRLGLVKICELSVTVSIGC